MNKIEELIEQLKIYTGLVEKKPEKKKCNVCAIIVTILAVIGAIVAIGFALYKSPVQTWLNNKDFFSIPNRELNETEKQDCIL